MDPFEAALGPGACKTDVPIVHEALWVPTKIHLAKSLVAVQFLMLGELLRETSYLCRCSLMCP
jgi:hypothetical protein